MPKINQQMSESMQRFSRNENRVTGGHGTVN
jgi:hypothetical protein